MSAIDIEEVVHLLNRRRFLAGSAALAAVPLMPWQALAQMQAPYSFKQGDLEVTVVSDGSLRMPMNLVSPDASAEQLAEIAKRLGWTSGNAEPAANPVLIRSANEVVLFDTGSGKSETAGQLLGSLNAVGIEPAHVTKIVFTHGHPDHIWGTTLDDGALVFPNAAYYVGGTEWNFWTAPDLAGKVPEQMIQVVNGAQKNFSAVKDRVTMIKGGDEVIPGVKALDTPGHTPGHLSFEVAGGEGLLITGDATTNQIVSFEHPEWKFGFDADHDTAIKTRQSLLDRAATDKIKLIGFHWLYPGVGFAERKDNAYRYVPVAS
jgi:glyoxylase-like metal-dependent hydrolase (beta-lactamase superfamily II)